MVMNPNSMNPLKSAGPQYGLAGAVSPLQAGRQRISDIINQGASSTSGLQSFANTGQQASQYQASLAGALGRDAQANAYDNFQRSPGQAFLQQEGERALLRNAAARGGLGGGNLSRDLIEYGQGLALQDLNATRQQLGEVANRGANASSNVANAIANLRGQQAGLESNLAGAESAYRYGTGQELARQEERASTALANLIQQQGTDLGAIYGTGTSNISRLLDLATEGDYSSQLELASLLGNLAVHQGNQLGRIPVTQRSTIDYLGQLGQISSGVGGLVGGIQSGLQNLSRPDPWAGLRAVT